MLNPIPSTAAIVLCLTISIGALSQIQIGTVKGVVLDPAQATLSGAKALLHNPVTGYKAVSPTDENGNFTFDNVPFARYTLVVTAAGFQAGIHDLSVQSNIPVICDVRLKPVGASESVTVEANRKLVEPDSSSTAIEIHESSIERQAGATHSRQLPRLIATAPGLTTENNGLLHVRGVDDGILYVIDGVPTSDRIDGVSASTIDTEIVQSLNIVTGNIPAEFGGRAGAVVTLQAKSGINAPFSGSIAAGAGNFHAGQVGYTLGGGFKNRSGILITGSGNRSSRFLDPVDPGNLNNRGGALTLNVRADWHPTSTDIVLFNISMNGTDFRVPNDLEQELAGQRRRQELRDNKQSVSWQRVWSSTTVSNLACFRRFFQSSLIGSRFDMPIFANQDRRHARYGMIASITHFTRGHMFKAGTEATRVALREFFTFAITDKEVAERREVSEKALVFDLEDPFVFRDRKARAQASWYVQDSFSPVKNLAVNAGLRYDHSSLLQSEQQYSPRIGAVYYIPSTKTAIRGSFNKLYQPPQVENLLLSDSDQARRLSPFAETKGGATVRSERVSAYEVGFSQDVLGLFRLDSAYWYRSFRNFDDPNVFFDTTIIFPNSVAGGFARGVDVRVDFPERKGWSGYLSYTNQRILQTGPINGGLFLTDEFIEIGPGTKYIPDHDQRNVGSFNLVYHDSGSGLWTSFSGRHESGAPMEVEQERLEELRSAPGSDLVDFERGRVKPRTIFGFSTGVDLLSNDKMAVGVQLDIENIANRRFAYNFGNPFAGTHFGHPRLWAGRVKLTFR